MKMIKDLLLQKKHCRKIAIESSDRSITYQEWYKASKRFAGMIRTHTDHKPCNIVLCLPNSIEYAVAYFAILFSGNVIVPIAPDCADAEITSLVQYCDCPLIITNERSLEKITRNTAHLLPQPKCLIMDYSSMYPDIGPEEPCGQEDENALCIMLHTSGTTSEPKRVMLSNKNLMANIKSHTAALSLDQEDVSLIVLPMFFGYCNTSQFLAHLYTGGKIVIHDGPLHPVLFWKTICRYGITNVTVVPAVLVNLFKAGPAAQRNQNACRLRYICYGGGRSNKQIIESLVTMFPGIGFVHTYGQTECSPRVTALLPNDALRKSGSVGTPIPGVEIRIQTPSGAKLEPGGIGEVCVRGANVMLGYYKRPELTEKIIKDGWLHTGDEGYLDEDGFLYLCGRLKNIIIYNGINLYPEEIENVLLASSMICDAIVYGVDDNINGEIPVADVVVSAHYDEKQLRQHCKKYLSDHKIPKTFRIVEKIEKTYNHKNKRW